MYWYPLHGPEYRGGASMWNISCVSVPREFYEYIQCRCPVRPGKLSAVCCQHCYNIGSNNRRTESHHLTFWPSLIKEKTVWKSQSLDPIFSSSWHSGLTQERCLPRSRQFPMNANEETQVIALAPVLINNHNHWLSSLALGQASELLPIKEVRSHRCGLSDVRCDSHPGTIKCHDQIICPDTVLVRGKPKIQHACSLSERSYRSDNLHMSVFLILFYNL